MAPLRILICGAGIAGPAFAFWMARLGHSCTILERAPSLRANGQQVDLREQGFDVVQRMGLMGEIHKHLVDEEGLQFVDLNGTRKGYFPRIESGTGRQGQTSEFEIMRGDLCRLLADATTNNVVYRFGLSVDEFKSASDHVKVKLSDGSEEVYDMMVGADGQGSRTRRGMFEAAGAATDCIRGLGLYCAYFTLPRVSDDPNLNTAYIASGRRAIATRWHNKDRGQCYFATMANQDELEAALQKDVSEQKDAFAAVFKDAGWQADRLIREMYAAEDFYAQPLVQIHSNAWSQGRVVLLGDAGYCPSPITGMGTSLAFVGAYVLAGEISKYPGDLDAAFLGYEHTLRQFVEQTQKLPPGVPGMLYPQSEWGVKIIQYVLQISTMLKLDRALQFATLPGRNVWKLPQYPQLDALIKGILG